jgi:hypothetical protein
MMVSTGLKILYSFLKREYIILKPGSENCSYQANNGLLTVFIINFIGRWLHPYQHVLSVALFTKTTATVEEAQQGLHECQRLSHLLSTP